MASICIRRKIMWYWRSIPALLRGEATYRPVGMVRHAASHKCATEALTCRHTGRCTAIPQRRGASRCCCEVPPEGPRSNRGVTVLNASEEVTAAIMFFAVGHVIGCRSHWQVVLLSSLEPGFEMLAAWPWRCACPRVSSIEYLMWR